MRIPLRYIVCRSPTTGRRKLVDRFAAEKRMQMNNGNSPYGCDSGPLIDLDDEVTEDLELREHLEMLDGGIWENAKCECGADKVGSPRHSSWCPKFKEQK